MAAKQVRMTTAEWVAQQLAAMPEEAPERFFRAVEKAVRSNAGSTPQKAVRGLPDQSGNVAV